jgi:formylglycine-generating enzyme required for sulfatase activity
MGRAVRPGIVAWVLVVAGVATGPHARAKRGSAQEPESSPSAHAHRPTAADAWWAGLDDAQTRAPGQGVQVLRAARGGRVRIAGGTFVMGSTRDQIKHALDLCEREVLRAHCRDPELTTLVGAEARPHAVTLSTFDMDRTEVRVGDYGRCVSAGVCAPADIAPDDTRFSRPELPVTHVRYDDAATYCTWAGGRLPTEAEWEYAARGQEGREFPWGSVYNPHLANHGAWAGERTDATDGFVGLAPVGSFPDGATPLGLLDMAGNAGEWVADLLGTDPGTGLPVPYDGAAVTNPPPNTRGGGFHVVRGGSYEDAAMWLRTAARGTTVLPRPPSVGFRCAADVR